ncbi:MAG: hypothetical protein ABIW58_03765 [Sphingomicrobium sp.]
MIHALETEAKAADYELSGVREELKTVKRKYRSVQQILEQERGRLKAARKDLAKAQATVAYYRGSLPWRIYSSSAGLMTGLKKAGQRFFDHPRKRQREQPLALLEQSTLFDRDWYLETYPDVAASGIDPAVHYLETGWREGRDAGPGFSTSAYLKANSDVAANGINPLLHYVEYGHSEGRGAPEHAAPRFPARRRRQDFGPAAPCVAFPSAPEPFSRWARSGKIDAGTRDVLQVGNDVGFFRDEAIKLGVQAAIAGLSDLRQPSRTMRLGASGQSGPAAMLDAWYVNSSILRTRWQAQGGSVVVRILQHAAGAPVLIGEAFVSDRLDAIDAKLFNPFFPLLFLFADCDGAIIGWQSLVFPSLCRGGLHYPELVLLAQLSGVEGGVTDPCLHSEELAGRLQLMLAGEHGPLISAIEVDLTEADGSGPLFQPDFQNWLREITGVAVTAHGGAVAGDQRRHLATAVQILPEERAGNKAGRLILGSDMVPSISALVAGCGPLENVRQSHAMPFAAASMEHSQPATLLFLPRSEWPSSGVGRPRAFPRLESASSTLDMPVAAIRMAPSRPLHEAELLVPVAAPKLSVSKSSAGISWLLWPNDWREDDLLQSLETIAAQTDAGPSSIVFVGSEPAGAGRLAEQLFVGRVRSVPNVEEALPAIDTPLAAYVGPNVILHDRRTAAHLSTMLDEPRNATASVVMVTVEKRGKGWLVATADAGTIPTLSGSERTVAEQSKDAMLLWRATWSGVKPPRDLWMTRAKSLAVCLSSDRDADAGGLHICSALITASYSSPPQGGSPPLSPPANAPHRALRTESLVG